MLGRELFDRAVKLGPEADVIHAIIDQCGPDHFTLLLPYIQRLTQLTPEDPSAWIIFGIALGTDQQTAAAQKALREAAQLARKQGNHDVAQQADEMHKMVSDPMFALVMQTMPFMNELGGMGGMDMADPFDDFDDDEDLGDFYDLFRPVRRKRRKR
ncbi:MAG: hypothetical protein HC853_04875 [Anaerolineae bacterium]|nr:hypothetical protein [Anaerolineae bacterium]